MKEDRLVPAGGKDQEQMLPWQSDRVRDEAARPTPEPLCSSPATGDPPRSQRHARLPNQRRRPLLHGQRRLSVGSAALLTPRAEKHTQTKGALCARAAGGTAGSECQRRAP